MENLHPEKVKAAVSYLDDWLNVNFQDSRLPGLQIAIQHADDLVYSRAFGYADVAAKTALTTKHAFRIASHSKTFTATAIMQLVEAGQLALDDAVSEHLDWFNSTQDDRVRAVTIRQLMNHTAGLVRDGLDSDHWQVLRDFPKEQELRDYISTSRLFYDSDTRFKYSNFGYGLLGLVVAKVSGMPYRDYVTKNIVAKLGLQSTGPELDDKARQLLAEGYGFERFGLERPVFDHINTHALSSATGFYANAEDVCKYFSAHFFGNLALLSDASKRHMQHGYWETQEDGERYGLGMENVLRKGWTIGGHGGGFPGFITKTQFDPQRKLVVSVLTNCYGSNASSICKKIINIIDTFQQGSAVAGPTLGEIKKFTGRFYASQPRGSITDVVAVGDKLLAIEPLDWTDFNNTEELEVVDDAKLLIKKAGGFSNPGEHVIYKFDDSGAVQSIRFAGFSMVPYTEAVRRGWPEIIAE